MSGRPAPSTRRAVSPATEPTESLKARAYRAIKTRVLTNQLAPGTFVSDQEEAMRLGMSRTPVREALQLLESDGLVAAEPRRGVRVLSISRADVREVYEVLTALEVKAVELIAARGLGAEGLAPLDEACEAMSEALDLGVLDRWSEADEAFHRALLTLSGNRHLMEAGLRYRDRIQRAHFVALRLRPEARPRASLAAHRALVDALARADGKRAVDLHARQREGAGRELIGMLDRLNLDAL